MNISFAFNGILRLPIVLSPPGHRSLLASFLFVTMGLPHFPLLLPATRPTCKTCKWHQVHHETVLGSMTEEMPICSDTAMPWAFHLCTLMGPVLLLSSLHQQQCKCTVLHEELWCRQYNGLYKQPQSHPWDDKNGYPHLGVEKAGVGRAHRIIE